MNLQRHLKRSILNQIQIYCLFSYLIRKIQLNALQFKFFSYTSTVMQSHLKVHLKALLEKKQNNEPFF